MTEEVVVKAGCGKKVVSLIEEPVVTGAGIGGGGGGGIGKDGVTGAEEGVLFSESTKNTNEDRED